MANDKTKNDKTDLTIEERLKALYQLQTLLSKIDEIKAQRGELPNEITDLEAGIEGLKTRIEKFQNEIDGLKNEIAQQKANIENAKAKIDQYNEQIKTIRNNREYDHLAKEIEFQSLEIELSQKKIREASELVEKKIAEMENTKVALNERCEILEEKKGELDKIVLETKQDEEKLRIKAKKLEEKIEPRLLSAFKRIRKNVRNGLGIVCIQRKSCGGCFNRIPPQRQSEIRMHKKIIQCEYCGRIMIDPELAGIAPEESK